MSRCHSAGNHMSRLIIMRKTINDTIYKHLEEFKEDMHLLLLILVSTYYLIRLNYMILNVLCVDQHV